MSDYYTGEQESSPSEKKTDPWAVFWVVVAVVVFGGWIISQINTPAVETGECQTIETFYGPQERCDTVDDESNQRSSFVNSGDGGFVYENCDAVRADGADPIHWDDPGYGEHLDRDNDGVGCEPYYGP